MRGISKTKFTNSEKLEHKQRWGKYLKKQLIKVQALIKVAEQGTPMEQERLAYMYLTGKGAQHDYTEAFKWYKKAAEQGHSESQRMVGYLYGAGLGVTQNSKEAIKWYKKAVEQGNLKAQDELGGIYYFGPYVGDGCSGHNCFPDYKEGLKLFKKAANQGYVESQYMLGLIYDRGDTYFSPGSPLRRVTKDYVEAYKWYSLAASQDENYAKDRDGLGKRMTKEQIEEAKKLVSEFVPIKK